MSTNTHSTEVTQPLIANPGDKTYDTITPEVSIYSEPSVNQGAISDDSLEDFMEDDDLTEEEDPEIEIFFSEEDEESVPEKEPSDKWSTAMESDQGSNIAMETDAESEAVVVPHIDDEYDLAAQRYMRSILLAHARELQQYMSPAGCRYYLAWIDRASEAYEIEQIFPFAASDDEWIDAVMATIPDPDLMAVAERCILFLPIPSFHRFLNRLECLVLEMFPDY